YAVTKWAVDRARRGEGPALIEALTYRMEAHSGSDDPTRYRPAADIDKWGEFDPLVRYRRVLPRPGPRGAGPAGGVGGAAGAVGGRRWGAGSTAPRTATRWKCLAKVSADGPGRWPAKGAGWRGGSAAGGRGDGRGDDGAGVDPGMGGRAGRGPKVLVLGEDV